MVVWKHKPNTLVLRKSSTKSLLIHMLVHTPTQKLVPKGFGAKYVCVCVLICKRAWLNGQICISTTHFLYFSSMRDSTLMYATRTTNLPIMCESLSHWPISLKCDYFVQVSHIQELHQMRSQQMQLTPSHPPYQQSHTRHIKSTTHIQVEAKPSAMILVF